MLHQLTHEEYQELLLKRKEADDECAKARAELATVRADALNKGVEYASQLLDLVGASLHVVQFAVANLPPESIRGWPVDALNTIAAKMEAMPDYSARERDLAIELKAFAREAAALDLRRKQGEIR